MCPWVDAYVPFKKWGWISNTTAPWLSGKRWGACFCNSSKYKPHLTLMNLGMLSWNDITGVKKYCPIWSRLWYKLLANQSFSHNKPHGFGRERATLGDEMIYVASSRVNIEQQECCAIFWDFSGFAWTFVHINWVFYAFMCIIQISTTCTCSSAYKRVEKSNVCPWLQP